MKLTRRDFTVGALLAAGTAGMPVFVKAAGGKTVALLFDSLVSPFWVSGIEIMRVKAKEKGWETLENISNLDDNKQFEQVKAMIGRKVDGILIIQTDFEGSHPGDPGRQRRQYTDGALQPPAGRERRLFGRDPGRQPQDHENTVEFLVAEAKKLGGKYKACILIGDLGDVNAIQRRDGFFDVVDKNKDLIEVVARISTEWNADKAFAGLTNALQANPDINFLVRRRTFSTRRSNRC